MSRTGRGAIGTILLALLFGIAWALGGDEFAPSVADPDPTPSGRAPRATRAPVPGWTVPTRPATMGGGVVGLFIEPDDGRAPVIEELEAARQSIALEVYLLGDDEIIAALEWAHRRGIDVRVILEEQPYGGAGNQPEIFERLRQAGINVRWSNPVFRFTHIKTFVIDRQTAIIMNLNLTKTSFTKNRELAAITTRPADVAQAAAIFDADWARTEEPAPGPLVVSPTTSRTVLVGLIDDATRGIDIYAEVVRDDEVIAALAAAERRGVAVRLLTSDNSADNADELAELTDAGVEARIARGLYIHAKMLFVDNRRAYVGSQNFTATSLDSNRELGIVLEDRVNLARLRQTFDGDFARGTAVAP